MAYRKEQWGVMPSGEPVSLYTLSNDNGVSASFTDLGGTWVTMYVPDRDGKLVDVVLGYDSVEAYLENPPSFWGSDRPQRQPHCGGKVYAEWERVPAGCERRNEQFTQRAGSLSQPPLGGGDRGRRILEPLSAFLCSVPMAIRDTREMPTLR